MCWQDRLEHSLVCTSHVRLILQGGPAPVCFGGLVTAPQCSCCCSACPARVCFARICPARVCACVQELRRQDPALLQQIQANQGEFMRMVMEPGEGEGDDMAELLQAMAGGAGGAGGLPPGVVQVCGRTVLCCSVLVVFDCAQLCALT